MSTIIPRNSPVINGWFYSRDVQTWDTQSVHFVWYVYTGIVVTWILLIFIEILTKKLFVTKKGTRVEEVAEYVQEDQNIPDHVDPDQVYRKKTLFIRELNVQDEPYVFHTIMTHLMLHTVALTMAFHFYHQTNLINWCLLAHTIFFALYAVLMVYFFLYRLLGLSLLVF